jgi:hypothetical protein
MSNTRPGLWSLVAFPALITLIVTIVRLVGELQGWDPALFNPQAGGGLAPIGITWLVLLFGLWFGFRVRRGGSGVPTGRAAFLYALGIAAVVGGFFALQAADLIAFPTKEAPGSPRGRSYLLGLMGVGALIALAAWPRLSAALMLYGVLARLPVIAVTYLDLQQGWNTHYGELAPGMVAKDSTEAFFALSTFQLTFWPLVFTPLAGGLIGCIGAAMAGAKRG